MGSPITAWAAQPYLRRARSTPLLRAGRVSPELMTSTRVLVTGGAGFLGSHLCDALLSEGHSVVCVDNLITGREDNIAHLARESRLAFGRHDISKPFDFGAVDYVFNFASPASPVDYMEHGVETLQVGSFGTYNAL